jgi:formylglycine-generating enzyme required for sulfatase activity
MASAAARSVSITARYRKGVRRLALWGALLVVIPAGAAAMWAFSTHAKPAVQAVYGDGTHGPLSMAWVPGGDFMMGSDSKQAQPNERPAHQVRVHGFWMDTHHVTNAEFRRFVASRCWSSPGWEAAGDIQHGLRHLRLPLHQPSTCIRRTVRRGRATLRV